MWTFLDEMTVSVDPEKSEEGSFLKGYLEEVERINKPFCSQRLLV